MCDKFIINLNLKEVCILNISEYVERNNIQINIGLINSKIETKCGGVLTFRDGIQRLDLFFSLQADEAVDNEDFIFTTLGSTLNGTL